MKRKQVSLWKLAPVVLILAGSQSFAAVNQQIVSAAGGGNHGGSDGSHRLFSDWCNTVGSVLKNAKIDADMAVNQGSDYSTAIRDLTDGMKDALAKKIEQAEKASDQIDPKRSLTYRLLEHGIEIANALKDQGEKADRDQVIALEGYYKLIKKATDELDSVYYASMYGGEPIDHEKFESIQFEQFAKKELNWLLKSFTNTSVNPDTGSQINPTIDDKAFLIIAQKMTEFAAKDLKYVNVEGLYAPVKEDLESLSTRISKYLDGDKAQLSNVSYGINQIIVPGIRSAIDRLPGKCDDESFN